MKSSEQVEGETTHNTRLQHLIAGIRTAKVYSFCTVPANIYNCVWIASSTWVPRISNKPFIIYLFNFWSVKLLRYGWWKGGPCKD